MLKLVVYKSTYTLSIVGGYGYLRKSDRLTSDDYNHKDFLGCAISPRLFENSGYALKFKSVVHRFDSVSAMVDFIHEKLLGNRGKIFMIIWTGKTTNRAITYTVDAESHKELLEKLIDKGIIDPYWSFRGDFFSALTYMFPCLTILRVF